MLKRKDFKLGTTCHVLSDSPDKEEKKSFENSHNLKTTKYTFLQKLSKKERIEKIQNIIITNYYILERQLLYFSKKPKNLRMFRISSEIWPCYSIPSIKNEVYDLQSTKNILENYSNLKKLIYDNDIRISVHPGQYTMLVSKNEKTIENSIHDLEYHGDIFRYLGIDSKEKKFEINIHVGYKTENFKDIFIKNFEKLSHDLKKWLSIENDEFSYGIKDVLQLSEKVKICLDLHHFWIKEERFFDPEIFPEDQFVVSKIKESWNNEIPEIHASTTHEKIFGKKDIFPEIKTMKNKKNLRIHSDYFYNDYINKYVFKFLNDFDIMIEAKMKNLATEKLYEYFHTIYDLTS